MQIRYEVMFVAIGVSEILVQSRRRSAYHFTLEVLLLFRAMAKKDFTQVAFAVVQRATGEVVTPAPSKKQESGRKGGLVGGPARSIKLTSEKRKQIATKAATTRWGKKSLTEV